MHRPFLFARTLLPILLVASSALAGETARLEERFPPGYQYQVKARVQLTGSLTLPAEKGKPAPDPLSISGQSAIDYAERVLTLDKDGKVGKTVRSFQRIDFERTIGKVPQKTTLRPSVRRVVLLRHQSKEVAFSPDGALTWGEIDLMRTDVFTPALAGLLPRQAVGVGDHWKATEEAVRELTDMEKIDKGSLECRLERFTRVQDRRHARVSLAGTIHGVNEDGPNRQELDGYFYFDLESNHISYLSLRGRHVLLNKEGKEVGRVEGRFVLQRRVDRPCRELSDEALRGLSLEPSDENTKLLYDNPALGVKFLHPRRWRVAGVRGRSVALDAPGGNGLQITLDAPGKTPTAARFLAESRDWFDKQKARVLRTDSPRRVQGGAAPLEFFSLEAEMSGQRFVMDYYVTRQKEGGATLAARLLPESLKELRKEVEAIARTVRVSEPATDLGQ